MQRAVERRARRVDERDVGPQHGEPRPERVRQQRAPPPPPPPRGGARRVPVAERGGERRREVGPGAREDLPRDGVVRTGRGRDVGRERREHLGAVGARVELPGPRRHRAEPRDGGGEQRRRAAGVAAVVRGDRGPQPLRADPRPGAQVAEQVAPPVDAVPHGPQVGTERDRPGADRPAGAGTAAQRAVVRGERVGSDGGARAGPDGRVAVDRGARGVRQARAQRGVQLGGVAHEGREAGRTDRSRSDAVCGESGNRGTEGVEEVTHDVRGVAPRRPDRDRSAGQRDVVRTRTGPCRGG